MGAGQNLKAVPDIDEDTTTFSLAITQQIETSFPHLDLQKIGAIYIGSESHPYAVKPTSTMLAEYLNITDLTTADLEFACKAGTAALQIISSQVESGMIKTGLAIGADIAQAQPGDVLEATAGAGGAGFVISNNPKQIIAKLLHTASITTNTPDFWRGAHDRFPNHTGRFTGQPAYLKHVSLLIEKILEQSKHKATDFAHVVLHSPNSKFPQTIAKQFKFKPQILIHQQIFPHIGKCLCRLNHAQPSLCLRHCRTKPKNPGGFLWFRLRQ